MNLCGGCKWWTGKADRPEGIFGYDPVTYDPLPPPLEMHRCMSPILRTTEDSEPTPKSSNEAVVVDGSGYIARLLTGPDFGCVNQEPA